MPVLRIHTFPLIRKNIQVLKSLIYDEVRYQLSVNRNAAEISTAKRLITM